MNENIMNAINKDLLYRRQSYTEEADILLTNEEWILLLQQEICALLVEEDYPLGLSKVAGLAAAAMMANERKEQLNKVEFLYRSTMMELTKTKYQIDEGWRRYLNVMNRTATHPYHSFMHIAEIIDTYREFKAHCSEANTLDKKKGLSMPISVGLAVLFHDFCYSTTASNNEEASVVEMKRHLQVILSDRLIDDLLEEAVAEAEEMILSTKSHSSSAISPWGCLFLDLDVSILGSDEKRFSIYEEKIRKEYSSVPYDIFFLKRKEIMGQYANRAKRGVLFSNSVMNDWLSHQAIENLKKYL